MASLFPLGIAARLSIPLIAVAVLAAAANMIAREGVAIIRMSTLSAPPRPTVSLQPPAPSAQPPVPSAQPPAVQRSAEPPRHDQHFLDALMRTVDSYERAIQTRTGTNSSATDGEYRSAAGALRAAAANTGVAPIQRIAAQYLDRGQALIRVADQRRAERIEHSERSESIAGRVQHSLDGAWKIFGRVMARQSLLQLRTQLDAIRKHSESILSGDAVSADELSVLTASETEFAQSFEAHRKSLEKSDGKDWVRGVQEDFDSLVALRTSLTALNVQYDEEMRRLSHTHSQLSAAITMPAPTTPNAAPAATAAAAAAPLPIPPIAAPVPAVAAVAVPAVAAVAVAEPEADAAPPPPPPESHTRALLAALTAIVILFITGISIATVRSVLAPVRRILKATSQLAGGDMRVQITRGGIRELDTLAHAFNEMAARLAAAQKLSRLQHESLEATVAERTHKLQQLAEQDPLTSLPNRRHLSALLNSAMERANRDGRYLGVYFLDIDNFKNFNDSLGHVFGDRVLMSVANRLEEIADGLGFVARLGGDEFTFVLEGAVSAESVQATGWRLVQAFHELVSVDDRDLRISVSVGASIYPEHGREAEVLLRAADSALFRAKELGRSQLAMFTPELIESAATRFTIEQGLRRAIENSEFELVYQPEVDLGTSEMGLVEALLRWRMPDGRLLKPGEFLAVAEQSGLISEINNWVLRTAVADASRWHHGGWPQARVAINISPRQLLDHRFVEQILALLAEFGLPASCIELELTEMLLQTGSTTIAALRVLQSHGFGIALDDFGTGYSSLTSLEQLPLSRIKLDRSLIARIDTSTRSAAIARAIIDLCAGLKLDVTAEGIERPQQFAWLAAYRHMFLQGYLLSDAVPFEEVLAVKASLAGKIQDLLLSMPVSIQRRVHAPNDAIRLANS